MTVTGAVSLAQATASLQLAVQSHARPEELKTLALYTAEVGAREEASQEGSSSEARTRSPQAAVTEIFAAMRRGFSAPQPRPGFLALMKDPAQGFHPFLSNNGTEVAFFPTPESLGPPWSEVAGGRWAGGVGLVIFRNRAAAAVGMIFLHSLGKVGWSKLASAAWQSSGGSMAFPAESMGFQEALERVIDKGAAMTWKWRATDESLHQAGPKKTTGLGGSKGIVLYGGERESKKAGLRVYAEVLRLLGATLTGSDEGVDAASADFLAELAPKNVYGSEKSAYRGRNPTHFTALGIFEALKAVLALGDRARRRPVLAVGYGGIGQPLVRSLMKEGLPVSGVVERDAAKLVAARRSGVDAPLFLDLSPGGWTPGNILAWPYRRLQGFRPKADLARVIASAPGTRIVSPNGGPHPVTFGMAQALIAGGVEAVVGAANNQHAFDRSGSPLPMAWILQAAGIFNPADFVVNRLGATAVVSMAVGLSDHDMRCQVKRVGETVREDYREAFLQSIPPYVYRWRRAARSWNALVADGLGLGGTTPEV